MLASTTDAGRPSNYISRGRKLESQLGHITSWKLIMKSFLWQSLLPLRPPTNQPHTPCSLYANYRGLRLSRKAVNILIGRLVMALTVLTSRKIPTQQINRCNGNSIKSNSHEGPPDRSDHDNTQHIYIIIYVRNASTQKKTVQTLIVLRRLI